MDAMVFVRGLVIGFSIAAPVGPIGLLCVRRTLVDGRAVGFASGLGAATADAVYGGIAGFSLTAVSSLLIRQSAWLRVIGGIFLCYLGLRTLLAKPAERPATTPEAAGLLGAYASTFVLTLTNPTTILSFIAVFAGLGLASAGGSYPRAALLVTGVFLGSTLWWLILSGAVGLFRARLESRALRWVSWLSGVIIFGFGLAALATEIDRVASPPLR